jgi:hypothetical protein
VLSAAVDELEQVIDWLIALLVGPDSELYGGFALQEHDRDPAPGATARYEGKRQAGLLATTHIQDLHRDLRELGFLLAPAGATIFDRRTRWAVQEFQRYASLPGAAVQRQPDQTTTTARITLAPGDRMLQVATSAGFPATTPFRIQVGQAPQPVEVMEVTAGAGTSQLTVTRGVEGTNAATHLAGSPVMLTRWSDRLDPEPAWFYERYPGEATGVVNAWTRFVLERWKKERWRCPVVVEAWNMQAGQPDRIHTIPAAAGQPARPADNLWLHGEVASNAPRVFARDLTQEVWERPDRPPIAPNHPELDIIGQWYSEGGWEGPVALPRYEHTWRPEGEIFPEHLLPRDGNPVGPTLQQLTNAAAAGEQRARQQLSTYKVVRAVGEVEAVGYFDGVNAWDNAFLSLGLCHWTAGAAIRPDVAPLPPRPTWAVDEGELWGFLAYLKAVDREVFDQVVGRFGVDVEDDWGTNGQALFVRGQRKYTSRPTVQGRRILPIVAEFDTFRSWHWFYRVQMACRTVDGFRRRMWYMARLRLRDLLRTPWDAPAVAPTIPNVPDPGAPGGTRRVRIGDVLTSERGVALVYRWHILSPGGMVSNGRAGAALRSAFTNAHTANPAVFGGTPPAAPTTWGLGAERALIQAIRTRANQLFPPNAAGDPSNMVATLTAVHNWPTWLNQPPGALGNRSRFTLPVAAALPANERQLLDTRDPAPAPPSFAFDDSDLPLPAL